MDLGSKNDKRFPLPLKSYFSSQLWCLWKLPQEHNAYPDGFLQCPDLSYKVQNARNVTIKCTSCPDCPPGQEPTPPCGSNISKETASECSICRPKTYSEEHGSGTCKPCPNCGLRETINPCTSERGTQCGDCPRRHYQADLAINSCKECSKCCGGRSYAELECIYLKQCRRKNCTQQTEIKKNRVLKLEGTNKIFPTLVRAAYHMRIAASEGLMSRVNKNTRFKREVNTTLQKPNYLIDPDDTVVVNSTKFQAEDSNPSTTLIAERSATTSKLEKASFGTTSESNVMEPTVVPSSSYFGDGDVKKLLKILIGLACFGVLLLLFIATVVTCICWKRIQSQQMQGSAYTITCCARYIGEGYLPVLHSDYSTPQSGEKDDLTPQSTEMIFASVELLQFSKVFNPQTQSIALPRSM